MKRYVIKRKDGLYWNRERSTWERTLSGASKFIVPIKGRREFKRHCALCGHAAVSIRKKVDYVVIGEVLR